MQILLIIYAVVVAALVVAEVREARNWQRIFKPLAALGFCSIAIWGGMFGGTLEPLFGKIILAALIACAIGDVCLLSRDNPNLFKGGMAAFALGHALYIWAIVQAGAVVSIGTLIVLIVIGTLIYKSLHPKLPSDMRIPVLAYICIIMGMVTVAFGSTGESLIDVFDMTAANGSTNAQEMSHYIFAPMVLALAAVLFAISDIFVARDRFTAPNPKNALLISPLYFGAQALFALSPALLMTPAL